MKLQKRVGLRKAMLEAAYNAGWAASGEGWNNEMFDPEFPGDDVDLARWEAAREKALKEVLNEVVL